MTDIAAKLSKIDDLLKTGPQLDDSQRVECKRLNDSLSRAQSKLSTATKRGDGKAIASAERSVSRAQTALDAFVAPIVGDRFAPERIIYRCEWAWSFRQPNGLQSSGLHVVRCEMVLSRRDLSGPQYRLVALVSETGTPPEPRPAPSTVGIAWWAVQSQIDSGTIEVLS